MIKEIENNKVLEIQLKKINELFRQTMQNVQKINNSVKPQQFIYNKEENEEDSVHQNFQIE